MFSVLDNLNIIIKNESIKIKSLFRNKEIKWEDIIGYELKDVEGKYLSGRKIKMVTANKSITINSIRFEHSTIPYILDALKSKKELKGLFKIENTIQAIYFYSTTIASLIIVFVFTVILLIVLFTIMFLP